MENFTLPPLVLKPRMVTTEETMKRAVLDLQQRLLGDPTSIKIAHSVAKDYKVDVRTLKKGLVNAQNGLSSSLSKMGRPAYLSQTSKEQFKNLVDLRTLAKNGVTEPEADQIFVDLKKQQNIAAGGNDLLNPKAPSRSTSYRLKLPYRKTFNASVTNDRRIEALTDQANALSLAVVVNTAYRHTHSIPAVCSANIDAVTVLAGGVVKVKMLFRPETKKKMSELSRSVARQRNKDTEGQSRSIKTFHVTNAAGGHTVSISFVKERNMLPNTFKYRFLCTENDTDYWFFVIAANKTVGEKRKATDTGDGSENGDGPEENDDEQDLQDEEIGFFDDLNDEQYEEDGDDAEDGGGGEGERERVVEEDTTEMDEGPAATEDRYRIQMGEYENETALMVIVLSIVVDRCIEDRKKFMEESGDYWKSQPQNHGLTMPSIVFSLDGDFPQLNAIMSVLLEKYRGQHIIWLKFAGGCSLSQQPDDLIKSFPIIKGVVKSYNYTAAYEFQPNFSKIAKVEKLLKSCGVKQRSKQTFLQYITRQSDMDSKGFTNVIVKRGWQLSGIVMIL